MRHRPLYAETDPAVVRRLIAENPWATIVSTTSEGIVASHYPILLDEESDDLAIYTHVGRPDEEVHQFGDRELMVIVAGPNGYISPSWYTDEVVPVPTWNFTVAHLYGIPQILDEATNYRVLTRLVAHFEREVSEPVYLDEQVGTRLALGTVGIRVPVTRFVCKVKLSQGQDEGSERQVLEALRRPGPYQNLPLADLMREELGI